MQELKPRKPFYAVLLSAHVPGLGQMYNGELMFGALMIVAFSVGLAGLFRLGILYGLGGLVWALVIATVFYIYQIVDAWIGAKKRFEYFLKKYNHWTYYTLYSIVFLLICIVGYPILFKGCNPLTTYKIQMDSMAPVLMNGDVVLVDKQAFFKDDPKRWDVILFRSPKNPGQVMTKRIVGLPGESLEIKFRNLQINGNRMADRFGYYSAPMPSSGQNLKKESFGPISIPEGKYFVMGDNRSNSQDSRHFSVIDRSDIIGKPVVVVFSWDLTRLMVPVL